MSILQKTILSPAGRLLAGVQSRFRRAAARRTGSVLIIVIVLLLLLAILGAAYLSTTHTDRVSSIQAQANNQIDLMISGMTHIVSGLLVDDLNDPFENLRATGSIPSTMPTTQPTYTSRLIGPRSATGNPYPSVPGMIYRYGDIVSDNTSPTAHMPSTFNTFYVCTSQFATWPPSDPTISLFPPLNPPPATPPWSQTAVPWVTAPVVQPWLADRAPLWDPVAKLPYWQNISQSLQYTGNPQSILPVSFESPDSGTTNIPMIFGALNLLTGSTPPPYFAAFTRLYPGYTDDLGGFVPTLSAAPIAPGLVYHLFPAPVANALIAGDADGDGVADCLLTRIPGANFDGLTWYVGFRIIDNNSAVNINTAWDRDNDYDFSGAANLTGGIGTAFPNTWGFFQSNVGLYQLLNPVNAPSEMLAINKFRFNDNGGQAGQKSLVTPKLGVPYDEYQVLPPAAPTARDTDFGFISQGDAFFHQSISRLGNPGFNSPTNRFQPFPWSDTGSLAYHFGLLNDSLQSSPSVIENLMDRVVPSGNSFTTYGPGLPYRSKPYGNAPLDVVSWYNDNFNRGSTNAYTLGRTPIRPLVVTHNPVGNHIQPVTDPYNPGEPINPVMLPYAKGNNFQGYGTPANYNHFKGNWDKLAAYSINDMVVYNPLTGIPFPPTPSGPGLTFICIQDIPIGGVPSGNPPAAITPSGTGGILSFPNPKYWELQSWTAQPTKTNVNTATFRELFRAFWSVMCGNPANESPFGNDPTTDNSNYQAICPLGPFRSVIRDPNVGAGKQIVLDPGNMVQLRAAIAAVNTLGLRDQSQNIISRTIPLVTTTQGTYPPPSGSLLPTVYNAAIRVYSAAPQPFITEVYADTDTQGSDPNSGGTLKNPKGYVAIELHNPYSFPLVLPGSNKLPYIGNYWKLGIIDRTAYPNLTFVPTLTATIGDMIPVLPIAVNTPPTQDTPGPIVIPAGGFALLENYNADTTAAPDVDDATYRPQITHVPPPAYLAPATPQFLHATGPLWDPAEKGSPPSNPMVGVVDVYVRHLDRAYSHELVLLRPRRADGSYTSYSGTPLPTVSPTFHPLEDYNEGSPNVGSEKFEDMVPVDSFDFSGLPGEQIGSLYGALHYSRQKPGFTATYPQSYRATLGVAAPQDGAEIAAFSTKVSPPPIMWTNGDPTFGQAFTPTVVGINSTSGFPPIQIYNTGMPGPNPTVTAGGTNSPAPQKFPFGAFARNGDILDITFIGAYRIQQLSPTGTVTVPANFLELNSLPMDCSFAASQIKSVSDNKYENVGRFCPCTAASNKFTGGISGEDPYAWARNLFDYLTVQSPGDSYFPNVDPGVNDPSDNVPGGLKYWPNTTGAPATPVDASDRAALDRTQENRTGIEGLINPNTAPQEVLATLPFIPISKDPLGVQNNALAADIVTWRNTHGPFTSLFDLNQVLVGGANGFQNAEGLNPTVTSDWGAIHPTDTGAVFPLSSGTPLGAPNNDYQQQFLMMDRISNLVTMRSDTFTVYIVLEGWSNARYPGGPTYAPFAGHPNGLLPQLKVTRRAAFIADRSSITKDKDVSRILKTLFFPND